MYVRQDDGITVTERKSNMSDKIAKSKPSIAAPLFESMTMEELTATATALNLKVDKSRAKIIANLTKAVAAGKAQVKMVCTVSFKPDDGSASRVTYLGRTLRTYVSGPGLGNDTWLAPDASPLPGSPAPQGDE
jgi:hypothetical protein